MGDVEGTGEVDIEDQLELVRLEVGERLVAQEPRVVDHDVDGPERVERGLGDGGAALRGGDGVVVGHGLATGGQDVGHGLVGGRARGADALGVDTEVVHHHAGTAAGQLERVLTTEAVARAGHDGHLAIEGDGVHGSPWAGVLGPSAPTRSSGGSNHPAIGAGSRGDPSL